MYIDLSLSIHIYIYISVSTSTSIYSDSRFERISELLFRQLAVLVRIVNLIRYRGGRGVGFLRVVVCGGVLVVCVCGLFLFDVFLGWSHRNTNSVSRLVLPCI